MFLQNNMQSSYVSLGSSQTLQMVELALWVFTECLKVIIVQYMQQSHFFFLCFALYCFIYKNILQVQGGNFFSFVLYFSDTKLLFEHKSDLQFKHPYISSLPILHYKAHCEELSLSFSSTDIMNTLSRHYISRVQVEKTETCEVRNHKITLLRGCTTAWINLLKCFPGKSLYSTV